MGQVACSAAFIRCFLGVSVSWGGKAGWDTQAEPDKVGTRGTPARQGCAANPSPVPWEIPVKGISIHRGTAPADGNPLTKEFI